MAILQAIDTIERFILPLDEINKTEIMLINQEAGNLCFIYQADQYRRVKLNLAGGDCQLYQQLLSLQPILDDLATKPYYLHLELTAASSSLEGQVNKINERLTERYNQRKIIFSLTGQD